LVVVVDVAAAFDGEPVGGKGEAVVGDEGVYLRLRGERRGHRPFGDDAGAGVSGGIGGGLNRAAAGESDAEVGRQPQHPEQRRREQGEEDQNLAGLGGTTREAPTQLKRHRAIVRLIQDGITNGGGTCSGIITERPPRGPLPGYGASPILVIGAIPTPSLEEITHRDDPGGSTSRDVHVRPRSLCPAFALGRARHPNGVGRVAASVTP
jgi:hypothetical protein